eukprot:TRINITY_DN1044_c0_g1_i5.p1 TRINITY_DN1044_c0_g1~~TRINITY_DN1044_c0_g1_i5.p1  ORF type:complete len:233 (-),score=44.44 TRINITY_DN1044_c0_g1_i5:393-1091(-)
MPRHSMKRKSDEGIGFFSKIRHFLLGKREKEKSQEFEPSFKKPALEMKACSQDLLSKSVLQHQTNMKFVDSMVSQKNLNGIDIINKPNVSEPKLKFDSVQGTTSFSMGYWRKSSRRLRPSSFLAKQRKLREPQTPIPSTTTVANQIFHALSKVSTPLSKMKSRRPTVTTDLKHPRIDFHSVDIDESVHEFAEKATAIPSVPEFVFSSPNVILAVKSSGEEFSFQLDKASVSD